MSSHQPLRSGVAFAALAAHNAEEALYAPAWVRANSALLRSYFGDGVTQIWAGTPFRVSLLALTAALLVLAMAAACAPQRGVRVYALLTVLAVFAANAVFPHLAGALALRAYVPGVATAVTCVLPVTVWVYASTLRERFASSRGAFFAATVGVVFYAAVALAVLSA